MAVEHIVCMRLNNPLPEQELNALMRNLETGFAKIPGVVTVSMGANFSSLSSGFTHALVIRFEDRQAAERFMHHPDHLAAGKLMQAVFSDFVVIDYETERA